ncbi:DUF302 domain-containing protein [Jejudonia soesokkakensis]|uniref:DUF302 domain-containing protein n=1 Tax=Jejudonia soesokkakensis TaxID=1323432 RepID=A0ABW2MS96_9FLAO
MKKLAFLILSVLFISCGGNDDDGGQNINEPTTAGLAFAVSENNFSTTYNNIRTTLQSNSSISIVAEVNHRTNASAVGEDLRDTRVIYFGNPTLGTPIMQANQLAGLDLPQKILVYTDRDNNVFAGYNSTSYLSARYNVGNAPTLQQVNTALSTIVAGATSATVSENNSNVTFRQGTITIVSQNNFLDTYNNLRNSISDNPDLSIVAELDHQANAQSVGLSLNPTRVIIFGNANLGTPLMQSAQTTALDLPQKMLVWQEADGTVNISYNDPEYLAQRHGVSGNTEVIATISSALAGLAVDASN